MGSPFVVGVGRTFVEIGQFFLFTGRNVAFSLGVDIGDNARYRTLKVNYFIDSYFDVAITIDGARNVPFYDALKIHSCGCNKPIQ